MELDDGKYRHWYRAHFYPAYLNFRKRHDFYSKRGKKRFRTMSRDSRLRSLIAHLGEVTTQDKYFPKIDCLHCGHPSGGIKNHIIGKSKYLQKFLSHDGFVYVLKKGVMFDFGLRSQEVLMPASSEHSEWKCVGIKSSSVTFRGFCGKCDSGIFIDIDTEIDGEGGLLKQIYRSACSAYFRLLDQTIRICYVCEISKGARDRGWLDLLFRSPQSKEWGHGVNGIRANAIEGAYHRYCVTKSLSEALNLADCHVDILALRVKSPSIYCGFVCGHGPHDFGEPQQVGNLYKPVHRVSEFVVTLPLKKDRMVVASVMYPVGIKGFPSLVNEVRNSSRPDIALSRHIIELGAHSLGDFYMAPQFYNSMPPEHRSLIANPIRPDSAPQINLFDV